MILNVFMIYGLIKYLHHLVLQTCPWVHSPIFPSRLQGCSKFPYFSRKLYSSKNRLPPRHNAQIQLLSCLSSCFSYFSSSSSCILPTGYLPPIVLSYFISPKTYISFLTLVLTNIFEDNSNPHHSLSFRTPISITNLHHRSHLNSSLFRIPLQLVYFPEFSWRELVGVNPWNLWLLEISSRFK